MYDGFDRIMPRGVIFIFIFVKPTSLFDAGKYFIL